MRKLTISEFRNRFTDDDACLNHLFTTKYGNIGNCLKCGEKTTYTRVKGRRAYQCPCCSFQVYPTAGTIFHKSTTPLNYWFYALYLFTVTRNGVSAKELERQLSISYPTALRMAHQIKTLMKQEQNGLMEGVVMVDEVYIGGRNKNKHLGKRKKKLTGYADKQGIFGMITPEGEVRCVVFPAGGHTNPQTIQPMIHANVSPQAHLVTDGHGCYYGIEKYFKGRTIVYHEKGKYQADGFSTNKVENFWSNIKRMIKGTHIHVSPQHLPKYVDENIFRYTYRKEPEKMLDILLSRV